MGILGIPPATGPHSIEEKKAGLGAPGCELMRGRLRDTGVIGQGREVLNGSGGETATGVGDRNNAFTFYSVDPASFLLRFSQS